MQNKANLKKIKAAVKNYDLAVREHENMGSQHPEEQDYLQQAYDEAKTTLNNLIEETENDLLNYLNQQIAEITSDERFSYKPATVFENAPLALIQVEMKAKVDVLKKLKIFLGYDETKKR